MSVRYAVSMLALACAAATPIPALCGEMGKAVETTCNLKDPGTTQTTCINAIKFAKSKIQIIEENWASKRLHVDSTEYKEMRREAEQELAEDAATLDAISKRATVHTMQN